MTIPVEFEIFSAGKKRSSNGIERDFSVTELQAVADSYNPDRFKAPLIVSHNTGNYADHDIVQSELAFGFPNALKVVGNKLKAVFEKIAPEFVQWNREGRLLGISSSFYLPESPSNPYPGQLALRHIAGLGVSPPADKGIAPLNLNEGLFANYESDQEGTVEFMEYPASLFGAIAQLFTGLRESVIADKGLDAADKLLPRELIDVLSSHAGDQYVLASDYWNVFDRVSELQQKVSELEECQPDDDDMDYSEGSPLQASTEKELTTEENMQENPTPETPSTEGVNFTEQINTMQAQIAALMTENAAFKIEAQSQTVARERTEIASFVEQQINARRILPTDADRMKASLLAMPAAQTISFGEGQTSPRQILMDEIVSRKELYSNAPLPTGGANAPANYAEQHLDFSIPDGFSVEPESMKLFQAAKAIEKEQNVSFTEAVALASKGGR
jgi:hypothetical protein